MHHKCHHPLCCRKRRHELLPNKNFLLHFCRGACTIPIRQYAGHSSVPILMQFYIIAPESTRVNTCVQIYLCLYGKRRPDMTKFGEVIGYDPQSGVAVIRYTRPEACAKCGACGGKAQETVIRLKTTEACRVGNWVKVELPDGRFLHAAALAYAVPLGLLLAGLLLGYRWLGGERRGDFDRPSGACAGNAFSPPERPGAGRSPRMDAPYSRRLRGSFCRGRAGLPLAGRVCDPFTKKGGKLLAYSPRDELAETPAAKAAFYAILTFAGRLWAHALRTIAFFRMRYAAAARDAVSLCVSFFRANGKVWHFSF